MKNYKTNIINNNELIGRAKVPLVSLEGPAIISTIIAKELEFDESKRIKFSGVVPFDEKLQEHIQEVILPQVDNICLGLGVSLSSFELSINNVGALSSSDTSYVLSGYSADVATFIILLSVALKLCVNQKIVFTGHISSNTGDISQVSELIEKGNAALSDESIDRFLYPDLESENSMAALKPKEFNKTRPHFRGLRGKIDLVPVCNLCDVVISAFSEETIIWSSLENKYLKDISGELAKTKDDIVIYLNIQNEDRFWRSLEKNYFAKNIERGRDLVDKYLDFIIEEKVYPNKFGNKLNNLILSLPLTVTKDEGFLPIIKKDKYIKLIQNAREADYNDITILHKLTFINKLQKKPKDDNHISNMGKTIQSDIIDFILERLNSRYIDEHITAKIDSARSKYIIDRNRVDSYEELVEAISRYYQHILRQTSSDPIYVSHEQLQTIASDIIMKTYSQKSTYNQVIVNSINESNGGLIKIFENITEYIKQSEKDKYVDATINELVDPTDFELKKSLIEEIFKRESKRLSLSDEIFTSTKYVENYIEIIKQYANTNNKIQEIFERI